MDSEDIVEPVDAALQELLAAIAERTDDNARRDAIMDHILTAPPVRDWPSENREHLLETCRYVQGVARDLRQRRRGVADESVASASAADESEHVERQQPT